MHVFGKPILLALISMAGLVTALVGDGVWDVVSWITLGFIVAVTLWYVWFAKPESRKRRT
jgi:hypothetical protein